MRGIEFMLFLSLTGTISCTQSVLNSTWWPCASLSPYQDLQLEQVMLFIYLRYYKYPNRLYILFILIDNLNPLKPSATYMHHLLQNSLNIFAVCSHAFRVSLRINRDYFLEHH
jgi:hypothetical protein